MGVVWQVLVFGSLYYKTLVGGKKKVEAKPKVEEMEAMEESEKEALMGGREDVPIERGDLLEQSKKLEEGRAVS